MGAVIAFAQLRRTFRQINILFVGKQNLVYMSGAILEKRDRRQLGDR